MTESSIQPVAKAGLIALMAFFSVMLWFGIPLGWLWIVSQVGRQPGRGLRPLPDGHRRGRGVRRHRHQLLATLNRTYARVSGETEVVRVRAPWHRSMRGEDDSRPPRSVLDVVMVISVSIALVVFGVWFFVFAGSSLPT